MYIYMYIYFPPCNERNANSVRIAHVETSTKNGKLLHQTPHTLSKLARNGEAPDYAPGAVRSGAPRA